MSKDFPTRTIHLTLKYHWWDKIASGEKLVEHRNITERWWKILVENRVDYVVFHRGYTATTLTRRVIYIDLGPDTDPGINQGTGEYIRLHLSTE